MVNTYNTPADYDDLRMELMKVLAIEPPFSEEEFRNMQKEDIIDQIHAKAIEAFDRKSQQIIDVAVPVITRVVEEDHFQGRVIVPMTDGKRIYSLTLRVEDTYACGCRNIVKEWHKAVLLMSIDELWKEHLRELDQLRQSVRNASYEQKDPLVIYKVESFHLFEQMLNNLNIKAISTLMRGQIYIQQRPDANAHRPAPAQQQQQPAQQEPEQAQNEEKAEAEATETPKAEQPAPAPAPQPKPQPKAEPKVEPAMPETRTDYSRYRATKAEVPGADTRAAASAQQGEQQKTMPAKAAPRIGRNDPCPCGSGKKYKNCHGRGL